MSHALIRSNVFAAAWDRRLTRLTWGVGGLAVGATLAALVLALNVAGGPRARAALLAAALAPLLVLALAALLAPRGYSIEASALRIERRLGSIAIPLASIRKVEPLPPEKLAGAWRVLGTAGFFGYFGRFRNRSLGSFRMYATRSDGHILVAAEQPVVLTPDRPTEFVAELRRRLAPGAPRA
jgi:hypothetical protein